MKKNGFTVIELLVVVAILGIVVGMTVSLGPQIGQSSRLSRTVNRFVSDINYAKQLASTENRSVAIDFQDNGTSYIIKKQLDLSYFNPSLDDASNWENVRVVEAMNGEQFFVSAGVLDFAFNSTGSVRKVADATPMAITFDFFVKKNKWGDADSENISFTKSVQLFPYGGVKVEK